ncbi:MAG TPA: BatA and WFA domain-containing protein [Tepidisphaeraceae bacterium]|nr:BatA and WFA domain-containing protein [Tepidisphaeraceae bacterium]
MTWFPQFDNKLAGLIAASLVIPALLILYFLKLRRKEMAVSSTFLWRKAIQDLQVNAPFQKLRRNLLLLLQLLLLIALLLSLSRPVANYRKGAGQMAVLLIDRSASMNAADGPGGQTRLHEAKRRAKELIDSMGRHSTAMVIAFDDSAETMQSFTTDASALRSAIDRIQPTDRKSRLKLAYQLAEAQTNFNPEQLRPDVKPPDVRLYSDGRVADAEELSIRGNLTFEKIGTDTAKNIGIVSLNAKRNYERPTEVQVFVRLANFGPDPASAPIQLSVDNQVQDFGGTHTRDTFLLPERWSKQQRDDWDTQHPDQPVIDSANFKLDLANSAIIKVEQMNKQGDVLAADDVAQVVVPPPKSLAVLLVTPGNYFLEKAVNSLGLKSHDIISPDTYDNVYKDEQRNKFDVFIFDRYKPAHLPPAGNFIYFLDGPRAALPDMRVKISRDPAGRPIILTDVGVLDWKRDHPILKDLALARLYVAQAVKLDVPQEDEVLVDGLKGPLIVLDHTGKATNLVVAFDSLQSNLPLKPTFPMFLVNALQYLAVGSDMDVRQSLEPGATPTIPRSTLITMGEPKSINLKDPFGNVRKVAVPEAGDFALPALNFVGLYTTDPPIPQHEQMAVNLLDANESNTLPASKAPGDINAAVVSASTTGARLELWWWIIAIAAMPLLLIEWWVYTRRVHL